MHITIGNSLQYLRRVTTILNDNFWDVWLMWTAPLATFLVGLILGLTVYRYTQSLVMAKSIITGGFILSILVFVYYYKNLNSKLDE